MGHTAGCDSPAQRLDNAPLVDYVIPGHLCSLLDRSGMIVNLSTSYASRAQVAMRLGHAVARSSDAAPTYRGSILRRGSDISRLDPPTRLRHNEARSSNAA